MTSPRPPSAISAMWVWDNPVTPAVDPRGSGYAPASADRLAAFARAGGLREVHILAPVRAGSDGAPATDPVAEWLRASVDALHADGVEVSAVAAAPDATAPWARTASALARFDRLQVIHVPWAGPPPSATASGATTSTVAALRAVREASGGIPVDACVPWWFAGDRPGAGGTPLGELLDGTPLGAVLDLADRIVLAAPAAHADGPGGVLELAAPALGAVTAAGRPFSVGVETDTPDAAGGADHTFFDEGPVALVRECATVAARLADTPGFGGVAVMSHRAWRRLLGV